MVEVLELALFGILFMLSILAAFFLGKYDVEQHLTRENDTLRRVQRNLNAMILDQRHQITAVDGLWATDQPDLIKHHAKRERFFRIGHPEDRL